VSGEALQIAAAIRAGERSAVEVTRAMLDRIEAEDIRLNAFTAVTAERALARAEAIDAARQSGRDPGLLAGVPFAVKNLFDVAGLPTLAGSKINRDNPAAARDAVLVRRLEAAGAVLVGALNMDEYAYGFTTENTHYGATRNPHDPGRVAGGSSGGSGAAVGGGLVPLALGSDTNGSIRVPAAFCGIFGLKPTYGRLPRTGTALFVAGLDHLGPFARGVADLAAAYDAMQGADPDDPVCAARPADPALPTLEDGIGGLRIARLGGYFAAGAEPGALAAVDAVADALGARRTVELPEAARARAAAFVITASEAANLHLGNLKRRAADFDPFIRDRLLAGALVPAGWALQAQRFRSWFKARAAELFAGNDILLAPATPCAAPRIGQETMVLAGVEMPTRPNIGIFTQPISLIGLPVVCVPVARAGAMPLGVQVIAAPWREAAALRVARLLEKEGFRPA
jgi:AtzE family amidohydrolase